jgi:hypothetical protein
MQNIFNKIVAEISPNLGKEMAIQVQETLRISRQDQKRTSARLVTVKTLSVHSKERVWKATEEHKLSQRQTLKESDGDSQQGRCTSYRGYPRFFCVCMECTWGLLLVYRNAGFGILF